MSRFRICLEGNDTPMTMFSFLVVIPGPHEPKKNINSYLRSLVNELWTGVVMKNTAGIQVLPLYAMLVTFLLVEKCQGLSVIMVTVLVLDA